MDGLEGARETAASFLLFYFSFGEFKRECMGEFMNEA